MYGRKSSNPLCGLTRTTHLARLAAILPDTLHSSIRPEMYDFTFLAATSYRRREDCIRMAPKVDAIPTFFIESSRDKFVSSADTYKQPCNMGHDSHEISALCIFISVGVCLPCPMVQSLKVLMTEAKLLNSLTDTF